MKWVGFAVGAALTALAAHQIYVKGALQANGKLLGLVPVSEGFGLDDVVAGAVILAAATFGVRALRGAGFPARTSVPV